MLKQLHRLERSYFELGQMFDILNSHYSVVILIEIINMFFSLLVNCYLLTGKIFDKMQRKKKDTVQLTYSELILICYTKFNFSSEENFLEYKQQFPSSIEVQSLNTTSDREYGDDIEQYLYSTIFNINYEIIKLILLIFSLNKLLTCKNETLDILKR